MGQNQGVIQPGSRFQSRLSDSPLGSVIQATGGGQSFRAHGPPPPSRVQRHARIALNFPSNEGGRGFLASLLDGGVPQQLGERRGVLGPPGGYRDRNHFVAFSAGHVVSHAGSWGIVRSPRQAIMRDRAWLGLASRSRRGTRLVASPPPMILARVRSINSRPSLPRRAKGFTKSGPLPSPKASAWRDPVGGSPLPEAGRKSQVYSRPPSKLVASVRGSMMTSRSNWVPGVLFCRAFDPGGRVPRTMTTAVRGSFSMRSGGGALP